MNDDEIDWHASDLAKTAPQVPPPQLPGGRSAAGEVEGKSDAPELVEISTVRVLGDIGRRLDPTPDDIAAAAEARTPIAAERERTATMWVAAAAAAIGLAITAWVLLGS